MRAIDTNGRQIVGIYERDVMVLPAGKDLVALGECADGRNVPIRKRYVLRVKGTNAESWTQLAWSPDSQRILAIEPFRGRFRIAVFNANGTGHRFITPSGFSVSGASWSPRGDQIVLARTYVADCPVPDEPPGVTTRCNQYEIAVMNSNGSGARSIYRPPVAREPTVFSDFDWYGDKIIFVAGENQDERQAVAIINADGSGYRNLTPSMPGVTPQPSWSPDGQQIAFLWKSRAGAVYSRVYLMNRNGGGRQELRFRPDRVKAQCSPGSACVSLIQEISALTW